MICVEMEGVVAFSHEPVRLVAKACGISWLGVVPGTGPDAAKREIRPRRICKNLVILVPHSIVIGSVVYNRSGAPATR